MARYSPVLAVVTLLAGPFFAPQASSAMAQQPAPAPAPLREEIRLNLVAEDWVATETADVDLVAELTLVGQDPAVVRREVTAAFKKIEDAPWRIVSFGRATDAAGAERWTIAANARIPQARLDGLHARARDASGPGKAFRVARIDTAPSLAEREAVLKGLRGKIYELARAEIEVAKTLWPGREVRIARVEFQPVAEPRPVPYMARAEMATAASAKAGDAASTERKIQLRAWVTLIPAR